VGSVENRELMIMSRKTYAHEKTRKANSGLGKKRMSTSRQMRGQERRSLRKKGHPINAGTFARLQVKKGHGCRTGNTRSPGRLWGGI